MIKEQFLISVEQFAKPDQSNKLWIEIAKGYSASSRHYHTLSHLDNLVVLLHEQKIKFKNWNTIVLAVAYHDLVYNTLKSNNEEKSALLAEKRLKRLNYPSDEIDRCSKLILATKNHLPGDDETNLFTDSDLSILGADPETYGKYCHQIRQEYKIYPDLIYIPGRKKVLAHFLSMTKIFKTDVFSERFEDKARVNLKSELQKLSG
jgi:predicted metal-dependent HD superfamily phosphohydrolase